MHEDTGVYAVQQVGLFKTFIALARYKDQGLRLVDKQARLIFESKEGNRPEIDRGQLRGMLLNSISAESIRWGHALLAASPSSDGGFDLAFRNGASAHCDVLVGADGAWSKVRPLLSSARPDYTGLTFFEMTIEDVESRFPEVTALVHSGLLIATADRKLLMAQRNATGQVRVYAALRVPEQGSGGDGSYSSVAAKSREDIAAQYEGWHDTLTNLVSSAEAGVRPWPIHSLPVAIDGQHAKGSRF